MPGVNRQLEFRLSKGNHGHAQGKKNTSSHMDRQYTCMLHHDAMTLQGRTPLLRCGSSCLTRTLKLEILRRCTCMQKHFRSKAVSKLLFVSFLAIPLQAAPASLIDAAKSEDVA